MLPFAIDYTQEKVVVTRVVPEGSQIAVGDEIRTINNVSTAKMVEAFFHQVGGDRNANAPSVGRRFHQILWMNEIHAPFDIEYVRAGGTPVTAHESGLSQSQIAGRGEQKPAPPSANEKQPPASTSSRNYRYERIEPNIAYIDFRQMVEPEKFDKFLRTTFNDIHENPPNGLIIDMRRNGGGDSSLGQSLFEYITDRPYKIMGRKEWKASPEYKRYLRNHMAPAIRWMPLHLLHPIGWKFLCAPDGKMVVFEGESHKPARRARRFDGPVCFLIGPGTSSSAMMTADAVAEFDLATLIGEETGGKPNGYGEIYSFDLPHTRLNISVSSALFVRASGDESDARGVLPDIEVKRTAEDRAKGIDTVLERAKTWVIEQSAQGGA